MRYLILLIVAFAVFAIAAPAMAAEDTETGTVTLVVPGVFSLWVDAGTTNWSPTLTQADFGVDVPSGDLGDLSYKTNYDGTDLNCKYSGWTPGSGGTFGLQAWDGDSFVTLPTDASYVALITDMANGEYDPGIDIKYNLTGLGWDDDPDTYTTTVTYQLYHS